MALVGDDCYFFLNSGCVRGSQCTFRHQPAARSTTVVCPQWLQRSCFEPNCGFRHCDDRSRNQTPCYFESNMGACYKPRCTFAHMHKLQQAPPGAMQGPPVAMQAPPVAIQVSLPVLPVLPPHPVLPGMPRLPGLPQPGLPGLPPPLNLTLPAPPVAATLEKPVTAVGNEVDGASQSMPVTPPPPVLPPPPKLAEMIRRGAALELAAATTKAAGGTPPADQRPPVTAQEVGSAPPAHNTSILGAPPVNMFPKSEHFNEQVRRFKEMLACKSGVGNQKKHRDQDNEFSEEEEYGRSKKERPKERQRSNKRDHKEKEGYSSHRASKSLKETWSRGDEEILYGDYKDVPLDKKSKKKKKHKSRKEQHACAESDPEVKVKSYEEILREKALRKLYSNRNRKEKEKFMEDFKELLNDNVDVHDEMPPEKTERSRDDYQKAKFVPDKLAHARHGKKYNSDGDEAESTDEDTEGNFKRRKMAAKSDIAGELKRTKKREEKRSRKDNNKEGSVQYLSTTSDIKDVMLRNAILDSQKRQKGESVSKNDDIKDAMLRNAILDSQRRQKLRHAKKDVKKEHKSKKRERRVGEEEKSYDLIEVKSSDESRNKEKNDKVVEKIESSPEAEYVKESSSDSDSDSDTYSDSSGDDSSSSSAKSGTGTKEKIIIPDETTNIDFTVDHDDDLAMEINESEKSGKFPTKTKKMSSVVSVINKAPSSFDKTKYHKKVKEREVTEVKSVGRHHKSNDHDATTKKDCRPKDTIHGRKSPKETESLEQPMENKKVVRLVNKSNEPLNKTTGRVSEPLNKTTGRVSEPLNKTTGRASEPLNKTTGRASEPLNKTTGRVSPAVVSINDNEISNKIKAISPVKVKSFEEIMAEKQRRKENLVSEQRDVPHVPHSMSLESHDVVSVSDSPVVVAKSLNATLKEKSIQAKLEILDVPKKQNGSSSSGAAAAAAVVVVGTKPVGKVAKVISEEEKQKRKSLQLYKPPHPAKSESELPKTTEIKMVVNTGPRKIIRIRKASLSTDLIDQPSVVEHVDVAGTVLDENDDKAGINVRSFDDIIREKRARQKKEREVAKQMEKENASSVAPVTSPSSNLLRRKPVLRRHAAPVTSSVCSIINTSDTMTVSTLNSSRTGGSTCPTTNALSANFNILGTVVASTVTMTTTTTRDLLNTHARTVNENKRPISIDSNVAKVSPLVKVMPQKRSKSDVLSDTTTPVGAPTEALENKDFNSRLRNLSSRRTSVVNNSANHTPVTDSDKNHTTRKLRKRSVTATSSECPSSVSSNHVTAHKISPYKFEPTTTLNETKVENHHVASSRKDIQEALDEEKRRREEDILSDDEFEKEINELGLDNDGDEIDDIDEDDLLMELEQMIDS